MGTRNVLVTLFLVLFVGGALAWYLAGEDRGTPGRDDAGAEQGLAAAEPPPEEPRAELADGGLVDASADAPAERVEVDAPAGGAAAPPAASADAEDTPRITGRVVDGDGRPVAGARVLAAGRRGFPLDFVAEGPVPAFVDRVVAATDADGRYGFDGVAPPSLRLAVAAPGYVTHEAERIPLPDVESYELPDVVLQPAGILAGYVVDPFGRGVAGARLHLEEGGRFLVRGMFGTSLRDAPDAVTDAEGRFRIDTLPLGAWRVRVETEKHPERTFEGLAERAGVVVERTFELEHGDAITGRVVDRPDDEEALVVRATPAERDGFGFGAGAREGAVGADGAFRVEGLRPGAEYDLRLRAEATSGRLFAAFGSRSRSEEVRARAGQRGVEIPYRPEGAVVFQVVDAATGEPVEALHVEYGYRWRRPLLGADGRPADTYPEGRVRIGNLRPDDPGDTLELALSAVGYESLEREDVRVETGAEVDLGVLRLEPLPMVRVTVLDEETGAPIEGATVTLDEQPDDEGRRGGPRSRRISVSIDDETGRPVPVGEPGRRAETDERGLAALNSLEGATAELRVTRDGYAPALISDLELPVGAAVERVVRLGRGGAVAVRVEDEAGAPVAGVRIDHRGPTDGGGFRPPFLPGGREEAVTDLEGRVRFEHLAEGEHAFRVRGDGPARFGGFVLELDDGEESDDGWERVEVTAGAEATVVLVRATRGELTGRITELGVELVGATVELRPRRSDEGRGFDFGRALGGGGGEKTDAKGRYALADVEPGLYDLRISHPTRRMPAEREVEIEPGANRLDVDLPVSVVEGRVTDLEGRGLADVRVSARRSDGGRSRGRMVFRMIGGPDGETGGSVTFGDDLGEDTRTDADGYYSLRGVEADVELVVRASRPGLQDAESEPVTVGRNDVRSGVDLTLEGASNLEVEVFDADGTPASFVLVRASYLDEVPDGVSSEGAEPQTAFVQEGSTRLTGLRPGRWRVSVSPAGPGGDEGGPDPQEVEVEVGVEPKLTFHLL